MRNLEAYNVSVLNKEEIEETNGGAIITLGVILTVAAIAVTAYGVGLAVSYYNGYVDGMNEAEAENAANNN